MNQLLLGFVPHSNAVRTCQKGFVKPFSQRPCLAPWGELPPEGWRKGVVEAVGGGVNIHALASPDGRGVSLWEAERDVETFRVKNAVRTENRCGDSEGGLWVESVQRALSGASRQLSRRESQGCGVHRWMEG